MGKNKKGRGGGGGGANSGGNPNQNNNSKENDQCASNNGDGYDNNNNGGNSNNNGGSEIVLKLNLHCDGCRSRIKKTILGFSGVKEVKFEGDFKAKVTPWANNSVDPVQLQKLLQKKTKPKTVEILTPVPKNDPKNPQNSEPKEKEIQVTSVVLKMAWDCDCNGCGDKIYKTIKSYQGVHEVSVDKDVVKVTGKMDSKKMVEMLREKLKKTVEIVTDKNNQQGINNGSGGGGGGGGGGKGGSQGCLSGMGPGTFGSGHIYYDQSGHVIDPFRPPQMFSDENPDGCSIM